MHSVAVSKNTNKGAVEIFLLEYSVLSERLVSLLMKMSTFKKI